MSAGRPVADWRSPALYDALGRCDARAFAWEWLRRSPGYQRACGSSDGPPAAFGLHRWEPVDNDAFAARPFWLAAADPAVLVAEAAASDDSGAFDLARFAALATLHVGGAGEHWLFAEGWRRIRLDVGGVGLRGGPAGLRFLVDAPRLHAALPALEQLLGLMCTGRLLPRLFPPARRAPRWALVLRVHDALVAGATQREIADTLFELGGARRWRIETHWARRRVQRLVDAARAAASRDPLTWLTGSDPVRLDAASK